jgi:hypothetical protein
LKWRVIVALAVLAGLAMGFAPAFSQAGSSGSASVSLDQHYILNSLGYGVLNDTFSFKNNGTSAVQIPTLQVGLPSGISSRASGLFLSPSGQFSLLQTQSGGNTTLTISPNQPTLNSGANVTVALKGFVTDVLNYSSSGFKGEAPELLLLSPSLNVNVTSMTSSIVLPSGAVLLSAPTGFQTAANDTVFRSQKAVRPVASEGYENLNSSDESTFTPISIDKLVRTIVPAANGAPTVQEDFTIRNLATYNITEIHLDLPSGSPSTLTELPSTTPPLLNPQKVSLSSGILSIAAANFGNPLAGLGSLTLTLSYPLPSSLMSVSGNSVKVTVPYAPLIEAPVSNYSILLAPAKGISPSGQSKALDLSVNPLSPGNLVLTYDVSVGWAADAAVPTGILVFAVAFAMFAIQRSATEEAGEKSIRKTSEVIRAFEEKTGLETQYMGEFAAASKGSIGKTDFDRMRNEVSELRSRAIQRLNEMKQAIGPGRQFDTLTKVAEAEKEEDRAFRDLLNLYMQYQGNRMNEETFKRLQPNYKKRVDSAINRLSDLLHETQTEER